MIVVTWCHRVLQPGEASLSPNERMLLDKICDAYYLPAWCSVADYQRLFGEGRRWVCERERWRPLQQQPWGCWRLFLAGAASGVALHTGMLECGAGRMDSRRAEAAGSCHHAVGARCHTPPSTP